MTSGEEYPVPTAYRAALRAEKLLETFSREHTQTDRERAIAGLRTEVAFLLRVLGAALPDDSGQDSASRPAVTPVQGELFGEPCG